jgi:hypothetical protein
VISLTMSGLQMKKQTGIGIMSPYLPYQLQHPIASWFDNLTGGSRSNQQAVDLENKVRQTQHPNGPTRTEHDRQ